MSIGDLATLHSRPSVLSAMGALHRLGAEAWHAPKTDYQHEQAGKPMELPRKR
jgi:hypothetical protein